MNVFVSWSGPQAKAIAEIFREYIPVILQSADVFLSSQDIQAGQRWNDRLNEQLENTHFGILCVTAENKDSTWLHYEAGALGKQISVARVVPVVHGLTLTDLKPPLGQFHGVELTIDRLRELFESINFSSPSPLASSVFERAFTKWSDEIQTAIEAIPKSKTKQKPREDLDKLDELLVLARANAVPQLVVTDWGLTRNEKGARGRKINSMIRDFQNSSGNDADHIRGQIREALQYYGADALMRKFVDRLLRKGKFDAAVDEVAKLF